MSFYRPCNVISMIGCCMDVERTLFNYLTYIIRVPNVHSTYNQSLLKTELKIAEFQFSIKFSFFNFQFLTYVALVAWLNF